MGCLYMVTSPSGKHYIGITSFALEKRWAEHVHDALCNRDGILYRAIRKYGSENFTLKVMAIESDWTTLCRLEREAIAQYKTCGKNGYNATAGGDGVQMLRASTKEKHRINTSIGTKLAWANGTMKASRARAWANSELKKQHAVATSLATVKAFQDPEKLQRMIDAHRRPEFRSAASKQVKLLWQNPDYRNRQVALRRARLPRTAESKLEQGLRMKQLIAERKANGTYWADSIRKARAARLAKQTP